MLLQALLALLITSPATPREAETEHLSDQLAASIDDFPREVTAGQVVYGSLRLVNRSSEPAAGCLAQPVDITVAVAHHNLNLGYRFDTPVACTIPFHLAPGEAVRVAVAFVVPPELWSVTRRVGLEVFVDARVLVGTETNSWDCIIGKRADASTILAP